MTEKLLQSLHMNIVTLLNPNRVVFGDGCLPQCAEDILGRGLRSVFIITSRPTRKLTGALVKALEEGGASARVYDGVNAEPTIAMFEEALAAAAASDPDAVVGLGGGSPMDVAKLVAAFLESEQQIGEIFGIGLLKGRSRYLACVPTTSGTGSEVSPNAILLDEADLLKKGVVSPFLVPDAAFVDPRLTWSVPSVVTASTGLDAMVHCIEAYANRFAHPVVDMIALEGIRLISANLQRTVENGKDGEARAKMALGSLYGRMCLGPVNTAAVHALAYPLGGEFHVAHGVSNSVLLPHVIRYNLPAATDRYRDIACAMGVEEEDSAEETAQRGLERMIEISIDCKIPQHMSELGVPEDAIPRLAEGAMTVTRLLVNNPREMTEEAARAIYRAAY